MATKRDIRPSIDGFRSPNRVPSNARPPQVASSPATSNTTTPTNPPAPAFQAAPNITQPDVVAETPNAQPPDTTSNPAKKRWFRRPSKRQVKWTFISILLLLLIIGGLLTWRALDSGSKVFKGNIFNAISSFVQPDKALKADKYGNTNILLLGTSESDPNHPGAQLTDAIMIMSVNKAAHTAFLLSIPRDLWVKGDSPCSAGYQYKINAVYECNLSTSLGGLANTHTDEATAEMATASKIGSVTGININYAIHMNLAVIQQVVDAVGGVDITIDSPDPRGILDRNFDWRCNYKCYLVKYPNGTAHLSGTNAMWLAQARNDAGGYGLPRSNFDREANQRKILIATRDKAMSIGFLANPLNAAKLLDAMGSNIHTTIDSSEIKSFIDIAKDVPSNNITSVDIMDSGLGILMTGVGPDGSSIVRPVAGLTNYSAVQTFANSLLMGYAPVVQEAAPIDVINGSGISGLAQTEADALRQKDYATGKVSSTPTPHKDANKYTLYDLSKGTKPGTLSALKKDLNVTTTQTTLPTGITSTASFVIILNDTSSTTTTH